LAASEDYTLSLLTAEELPIWHAARDKAEADGVLMVAWPFHCAVGRKPGPKHSPRPHVRLRTGRPASQYAGDEGCTGLASAEPHAWETSLMDIITYVGLDVHKATV
jgi:hypothetical protein